MINPLLPAHQLSSVRHDEYGEFSPLEQADLQEP